MTLGFPQTALEMLFDLTPLFPLWGSRLLRLGKAWPIRSLFRLLPTG